MADAVVMGITMKEFRMMYIGSYMDMYEEYKALYNFRVKRGLYKVEEEQKKISLLDL